jgi:tetratricopeptide (TPR) repeat protein
MSSINARKQGPFSGLLPRLIGLARARRAKLGSEECHEALRQFNRGVLMAEEGMISAAIEAYGRVLESGDGALAARSAFNIATLSVQAGDLEDAVLNYIAAIGYRDPDVTPKAAFNLAWLLEEDGDLDGAHTALQLAAASNHRQVAPHAIDRLRSLGAGR